MHRLFGVLVISLSVCACAGLQQARELPRAWSQTPDEVNKLPVGRVIAVERNVYFRDTRTSPGAAAGAMAVGPAAAVVGIPIIEGMRNGDWYYRHIVRLKGSGELVARDEYAAYKVGDCVALRMQPFLTVPALPGACD
jgi:hypothetical protein